MAFSVAALTGKAHVSSAAAAESEVAVAERHLPCSTGVAGSLGSLTVWGTAALAGTVGAGIAADAAEAGIAGDADVKGGKQGSLCPVAGSLRSL